MGNSTGACYRSGGACALLYDTVQAITLDRSLDCIQTVPNILLDLIYVPTDAIHVFTRRSRAFQHFHLEDFEPLPVLLKRQGFVWEKHGALQVPEEVYSSFSSFVATVRAIK